jgi:hypothetical protein
MSKEFLTIGNTVYYLDLSEMSKAITLTSDDNLKSQDKEHKVTVMNLDSIGTIIGSTITTTFEPKTREVDLTKYEMVKIMIDVVMSEFEEDDDTLGAKRALNSAPFPYKVAFNTLLHYNILKEVN